MLPQLTGDFVDFDEYVVERFGVPIIEASAKFNANLDDEWDRYCDYVRKSGRQYVSDCAVTVENRKRYLDTFGPMFLVYLTAGLDVLLERNSTRVARIPDEHIIEKFFAQELPTPWEGFMGVYLRRTDDRRVEAYGDEAAMKSLGGGKYDRLVSEEEWAKAGYTAHVNARGDIMLGKSEEEIAKVGAACLRAERDRLLGVCDRISPMRWEDMTDEQRQAWRDYRRALLRLPDMDGFPWNGDVASAPWPTVPK